MKVTRYQNMAYQIIENSDDIKVCHGNRGPREEDILMNPTTDMDFIEQWEERLKSIHEPYALVQVSATYMKEDYILGYIIVLSRACSFVFQGKDGLVKDDGSSLYFDGNPSEVEEIYVS